ncbi:hypothetical protein [Hydrogenophaga intermedia]|uniref:hypothetical protein n=1 Tax=Hydrogenophaga intermedia TaxID=65786 RepID=UPI002044C3ED|nr:hypothetical protein [Hydrogenophaga intermedia]MCM3565921.1 hypothetical protein [Hydrogenophaga intermedia]
MKVAPVSADLLIKLAIGVAVIGVGVWAVRRTSQAISGAIPDLPDVGGWVSSAAGAVGDAVGGAAEAASDGFWAAENWTRDTFEQAQARRNAVLASLGTAVNPANPENLAYRGVNAVGGAITGQRDFSLGVWLYELFNPEPPPPDVGIGYGGIDARRIDRQVGY